MKHKPGISCEELLVTCFLMTAASLLSGCAVSRTVYVQDATLNSPLNQPPIFVTNQPEPGKLRLMPHVSISQDRLIETTIPGHSPVNAHGVYQVDTLRDGNSMSFRESEGANGFDFRGKNLHWNLPGTLMGLDGEIALSKHFALTFGASYASGKTGGFWSGGGGLGLFSQGDALAIRFDGGVQWRSISYDIPTVVVTTTDYWFAPTDSRVSFYRDRGTDTYTDFYLGCTVNSCFRSSFVNFFVNGCLSRQKIVHLTPTAPEAFYPFYAVHSTTDAQADLSTTSVILSPGLSFELGQSQRALIGVRMFMGSELSGVLPQSMAIPFVQFDVLF